MALVALTRRQRLAVAWLVSGSGLLLLLLVGNQLWAPPALQVVLHSLYRLAYLAILPVHWLVGRVLSPIDHHWRLAHWLISAYVTPLLWWWAGRALLGKWRRLRRWAARADDDVAPRPGRRRVLLLAAGAATAAGGGLGLYGALVAPSLIQVRRYRIALDDLPTELAGLRIVHLSDTHYGPFVTLGFLEEAVRRANALEPDLVVLTGDYVHRTPRAIAPGLAVFAQLRPRLATLAVLGNHDHWEDAAACRHHLGEAGVVLVENEHRFVTRDHLHTDVPVASSLCVAGIGDLWEDRVSFSDALADLPAVMPRLLLSHNPDAAEEVPAGLRVDLMVSGHTHGGQIALPGLGAPLVPSNYGSKYAGGLCHGPSCDVLVSRGVGLSILPIRLGVRPEMSVIVLDAGPNPSRSEG